MRQKLNLITLGVDDFEKSLAFYEKGLGWKKSNKSMDGLALFDLGGIILALHPRHELADDTTLAYQPTTFSGLTVSHNTKSEKEVDEILEKVAKLGATIVRPGQKVYWAVTAVTSKTWTDICLKLLTIRFGNLTKTTTSNCNDSNAGNKSIDNSSRCCRPRYLDHAFRTGSNSVF